MQGSGQALPLLQLAFLCLLVGVVLKLRAHRNRTSTPFPLPPGPPPLPMVGNLFDMPTRNMPPALHELSKKYGQHRVRFLLPHRFLIRWSYNLAGDVMYMDILGNPTVVLDSYEAAIALLEHRSATTSDRPRLVMADL